MKRKINLSLAAITAIFLMVSFGCPVLVNAADIQLNYANFTPAPTFPSVQMERWKTELEKRTNGKVKVNTFPGGTLLATKNMYDGVVNGIADIGCLCMAYQPGRFIVTNALGLPLGIPNATVGSKVLWDLWEKLNPKEFGQVKVLTMFTSAPANLMTTFPIKTLEDIKGASIRASGGAALILSQWGANAVGMPMPATVEALQKGIVKGLFSSLEVMKDFKFAETCKYVTRTNTVVYPFAVVMNKKKWNALPDDIKKIVEDLSLEQVEWTGRYMDSAVIKSIEWSKSKQNVEVIDLTPEQLASWNAQLEPLKEKWVKDANQAGLPGEKMLKELQDIVKENLKN
jgi:TRAP-type transport system periplasmic protein